MKLNLSPITKLITNQRSVNLSAKNIVNTILHGNVKAEDLNETYSKLLARGKSIHELAIHNVKPEAMSDYIAAMKEFQPKLGVDGQFEKTIRPMLRSRDSQIVLEFAFWNASIPHEQDIIYELRTYLLKPGKLLEWEQEARKQYVQPVGAWFSQIGHLNYVHHMWAYPSLQDRKTMREETWKEKGWGESVKKTDSTKLAVAQSDCVVYVYKLGLDWGEKKSICNKFIQTADITCLTWPKEQHNAIVFGLSDGKVRVGNLKTNKAATLYQTESCVVSAVSNVEGNAIITGHLDGTINRFFFDDGISGASQGKFCTHSCPPITLAWGESIMAAGPDRTVVFYDAEGKVLQKFDYSSNPDIQDFTVAEQSPSGQCIVIGSFDRLHIFNYLISKGQWEEAQMKTIENFYTVSALSWKPDGSRLVVGNMNSAVELFDCCLRRSRYKGKFEFNYVSPSQVIVKRLSTGSRIVLKSHYGYEIQKVNIFQDQFLIANTPETLLMGDLASCKLSEVPWTGSGNEKFYFENPHICMVFNAGELSLVEYGVNELLGSCRTEHMSPHLISVRINETKADDEIKKVAYLVDLQTVQILDLTTGLTIATISHDSKIDWLELSGKANKLLFRDKRRQLHLYDIKSMTRVTLLHFCSYVQWVPNSDVVVAQSRGNLCIWYSIDSPERVTMFPIKGEIEDIERANGKTEVIVDEGVNTVSYTLDEGLIEFGAALDDKDYERAIALLETLEMTTETEAMWKSLSATALKDQKLAIAERCYAAIGDVARSKYLHNLNDIIDQAGEENPDMEPNHYVVRAKLAVLDRQFKVAENIYLEKGKVEEAMEMYQEMHKWDMSIKVAELKNHPELDTLKKNYFQWLIDSGQEEKAAQIKEEEYDYISAINLYLKGGLPSKAAQVLIQNSLFNNVELAERVAGALYKGGIFEKAGELYERLGGNERALDSYKKGKAFRPAVDLCRVLYPSEVVKLEEQWGDYLMTQKQTDGAINHYIEAGKSIKALEAAILAKQWKKAVGIVDTLQATDQAKPYVLQMAEHFKSVGETNLAEKYYVEAGKPQEAVEMYTKANKWEKAHSLAISYMSKENVSNWYISQAKEMESQGKLKDAEKLYITVGEPDLAINMYKNHQSYDNMIRLVTQYHKDLLTETHLYLGKTLESEGNLKQAEHHFIEANDFKSAINMYCSNNMFEEAYRVGKTHGGPNSAKQVAYLWARSLGGEAAVKLLSKFNLLDSAIDFATENGAFDFAFELSRFADKHKLADVHYKHAMFLEDEGKFKEAETAFILAGKPREAILMYIHDENWDAALAVAENYEPVSVPEVLIGQAKVCFNNNEFAKAESLILRAQRPELAIKMYKESNNWKEALRFTKQYVPNKAAEIHQEYDRYLSGQSDAGKDHIIKTAKSFEQQKEYLRAIEMYLKLSTSHTDDLDLLEEKWGRAADLAVKFVPEKGKDIVITACKKLVEIGKYDTAGELYAGIDQLKDAIDTFIAGGLWEKARHIVSYAPKYTDYVEYAYVKHLKTAGQGDALVEVDVNAGLEVFAQRGEWEKCLETAAAGMNIEILSKYLASYCTLLVTQSNYHTAVNVINQYGAPPSQNILELYKRISIAVLKDRNSTPENIASLRNMLFQLIHGTGIVANPKLLEAFGLYLTIAHYMNLHYMCSKKRDLLYFAAKQAISLLRYTNILPADKTFLEAGQAAKNSGMLSMAFVCWNRYLDLTEAIEEGDLSLIENTDFINTDVPFDVELPSEVIQNERIEQIRDWVLQVSLDQKVNQETDKRECENCKSLIYDASLNCYNCKKVYEPCVVTGYPLSRNKVKCTTCSKFANKDDWNKYVMIERVNSH
ncbi:hypothetical protein HK103_005291 [Boothiomyces macroporosus]|uniref:Intraflagellar transport protein 172 homolog n=1 Tax=Boothiomyces macroporosus TaxID=261099 RepID=A0AAD5UF62_9FUNG|nr:hypothetical protein HK103_000328 [Boothiomyces macroporosus]KAJ3256548.1 hypothetical protein HK103_005291 [Boothiomyces macroporosus]